MVGDDVSYVVTAHHRLVGNKDDVVCLQLLTYLPAHGGEGLAVVGVPCKQVIGDGYSHGVHEQPHLYNGGLAVLLANPLSPQLVFFVNLEVVVGHIIVEQRGIPVVERLDLLVQMQQQVLPPSGEDAEGAVDRIEVKVHLVEIPALAKPGGTLGVRGKDALINKQLHHRGEVVREIQVFSAVIDELVDPQGVEHLAEGGMADVLHTGILAGILVKGKDGLRHQGDGNRLLPPFLLEGHLFGNLFEVGQRIVIQVGELIHIPDAFNHAVSGLPILTIPLNNHH